MSQAEGQADVAVIGGSGSCFLLEDAEERQVPTPYGDATWELRRDTPLALA